MSATIGYSVTVLSEIEGKKLTRMTPDSNGVYRGIPLGALGIPSRNKILYDVASVEAQIKGPSMFHTKLTEGNLLGEYGHPVMVGNQNEKLVRLYTVDMTRVSHAILGLHITEQNGVTLLCGDIKPCGPYGKYLEDALSDPNRNVAFSLRSTTNKGVQRGGAIERKMKNLITFDAVEGPGFGEASKRYAAMEGFINVEDMVNDNRICDIIGMESAQLREMMTSEMGEAVLINNKKFHFDGNNLYRGTKKKSIMGTLFNR